MPPILSRAVKFIVGAYKANPSRGNALIISAVVAAAGALGVVISPQSVTHIVEVIVPILVGGELTHHQVTPVK